MKKYGNSRCFSTAFDLNRIENEVVEFKEAKNDFDSSKLGKYFSAISNEANLKRKAYGWLIFGVEDKKHQIVGVLPFLLGL